MTDQLKCRLIKCKACVREGRQNPYVPVSEIEKHVLKEHWYGR